jgi:hypothetical protein
MRRLPAMIFVATLVSGCSTTSPTGPQRSSAESSRSEATVEEMALTADEVQAAGRPTEFPGCGTPAVYHVPDEVLVRFGKCLGEAPPK